jgi:hypothetical protein
MKEHLYIKGLSIRGCAVSIFDSCGRLLHSYISGDTDAIHGLNDFETGLYILSISRKDFSKHFRFSKL